MTTATQWLFSVFGGTANRNTISEMPAQLKRIATDSHLWIPAAVLVAGTVLLLVVR